MPETPRPEGTEVQIAQRVNQRPPSLDIKGNPDNFQKFYDHVRKVVDHMKAKGLSPIKEVSARRDAGEQLKVYIEIVNQELDREFQLVAEIYGDPYFETKFPKKDFARDRIREGKSLTDREILINAETRAFSHQYNIDMGYGPMYAELEQIQIGGSVVPERDHTMGPVADRISGDVLAIKGMKTDDEFEALPDWLSYIDVELRPFLVYLEQSYFDRSAAAEAGYSYAEWSEEERQRAEEDADLFGGVGLLIPGLFNYSITNKIPSIFSKIPNIEKIMSSFKSPKERYEEYKKSKSAE